SFGVLNARTAIPPPPFWSRSFINRYGRRHANDVPFQAVGCSLLLRLSPYWTSYVGHQLQLAALVVPIEQIAGRHGGKPALRAKRQALERNEPGGFVDAAGELVRILQLWRLGGDEAEHHHLRGRQEAQRLESARARGIVVLEQEAIDLEAGEQLLGDGIVAALCYPAAA